MVFVVITEATQDFSFLQARGKLVVAEKQALGRKRAGLEVWQREHGVLGTSAHPCLELDLYITLYILGCAHHLLGCQAQRGGMPDVLP